ncbi:hypothetical protein F070042J6_17760 [Bacteroides sp. f07]|uniref:hypothetical protein n=1 Tax=Bacteroides sp. f07 TaxID=3132704 RepID=UPI0034C3A7ED
MGFFLTNLGRDKDRLFFSIEQSKKYGYKIERIPRIYGKDLSLEERNRTVNCFRFGCVVGRRPLLGEIGCGLLKENYPMVTPSDWWPRWDKYGIIELYNCNTKVCWHNNAESGFTSVISQSESKKTENMVSLWRKLYHKVMRLIGIVIDNVLMFFEKSLKLKWL